MNVPLLSTIQTCKIHLFLSPDRCWKAGDYSGIMLRTPVQGVVTEIVDSDSYGVLKLTPGTLVKRYLICIEDHCLDIEDPGEGSVNPAMRVAMQSRTYGVPLNKFFVYEFDVDAIIPPCKEELLLHKEEIVRQLATKLKD